MQTKGLPVCIIYLILMCFATPVLQTENSWNNRQRGVCPHANQVVRRPCTELLKYLTANDDAFQTRPSEVKNTWSGCEKDRGGPGSTYFSSSSSPSSSSTSSFSSLSSCSSCCTSKKKPSSASLSSQQQQQHQLAVQAQRGESQAARMHSVAGERAGQWRQYTNGEKSIPVFPYFGSGCSHICSSEEGRPLQCADTGNLAVARFIRYMHSYSLPPREMSHSGSCGHCLEEGGWVGASRTKKHIKITVRKKRQVQEHPMISQLLISRLRPARYRSHLQMPDEPQTDKQDLSKMAPTDQKRDWQIVNHSQESHSPDLELGQTDLTVLDISPLVDLDFENWLMTLEQNRDEATYLLGQNGVNVNKNVISSPMSPTLGFPSPLFPDFVIPEHTPSTTQGQTPHRQAVCKYSDDQVPSLLGNHCCIPALCLSSASPLLIASQFDYRLIQMLIAQI